MLQRTSYAPLRARQKLGKYRILNRIASGPQADVYRAFDTIHKTRVALKLPKIEGNNGLDDVLHEVRVATRLQHPNILAMHNASYVDGRFVIATELGLESLGDRLERRISTARALHFANQALAALAHAHEHRIIHCDIKPENYIVFPDNQLKLADFGFAKRVLRTLKASGSGTIDYIAPEQAMGRPEVSIGRVFRRFGVAQDVFGETRGMAVRMAAGRARAFDRARQTGVCGVSQTRNPTRSGKTL